MTDTDRLLGLDIVVNPNLPPGTAWIVATCPACGHPTVSHDGQRGCWDCIPNTPPEGDREPVRCRLPRPEGGRDIVIIRDVEEVKP